MIMGTELVVAKKFGVPHIRLSLGDWFATVEFPCDDDQDDISTAVGDTPYLAYNNLQAYLGAKGFVIVPLRRYVQCPKQLVKHKQVSLVSLQEDD